MHIMDDDSNRTAAVDEAPRNNGSLKSRRKSLPAESEKDSDSGKENGPTRETVEEKVAIGKEVVRELSPVAPPEKSEPEDTEVKENDIKEEKKDALKESIKSEEVSAEEGAESTEQNKKDEENDKNETESLGNEEEEKACSENMDCNLTDVHEESKLEVEEHKVEENISMPQSPAEDDDVSHASSPGHHQTDLKQPSDRARKRGSSESDQDSPIVKKMKLTPTELAERERMVSDYVDSATTTSLREIQRCSEKLQQEINTLNALARIKEQEWNEIIRGKKIKEEMYLRLQRRKDIMMIMMSSPSKGDANFWDMPYDLRIGENSLEDLSTSRSRVSETNVNAAKTSGSKNSSKTHNSLLNQQHVQTTAPGVSILKSGQNQLPVMMLPVVSSGNAHTSLNLSTSSGATTMTRVSENGSKDKVSSRSHRPILPKPTIVIPPSNSSTSSNNNGQNPVIGEGRQGPILDVRSIIADYRSKHPGDVPRRGRRLKSALSPNASAQGPENLVTSTRVSGTGGILSMASVALGSGSQMRPGLMGSSPAEIPDLGFLLNNTGEGNRMESSRPSSADSSRSGAPSTQMPAESGNVGNVGSISFKDVLVQFAKLSQNEQRHEPPVPTTTASSVVSAAAAAANKAPPYPEVTLHPVLAPHSPPHQSPSTSLLHGILTKSTTMQQQRAESNARATTFSPTLARLLTAPERIPGSVPNTTVTPFHGSGGPVSISDLLSTSKTRNEITITPVASQQQVKTKEEVVLLEEEQEDSADRLVIDESVDGDTRRDGEDEQGTAQDISPDEVPECQGCHQRPAQFVCAGCGNQWYCSRDCQVSAWDEHSEVCSG
ncbi:Uncharacterized protein GBIM_05060 [Gryllus bimaculatus]|nr:Uncharacterized protein GBIM_05060 [Gryllus bimaculatus]